MGEGFRRRHWSLRPFCSFPVGGETYPKHIRTPSIHFPRKHWRLALQSHHQHIIHLCCKLNINRRNWHRYALFCEWPLVGMLYDSNDRNKNQTLELCTYHICYSTNYFMGKYFWALRTGFPDRIYTFHSSGKSKHRQTPHNAPRSFCELSRAIFSVSPESWFVFGAGNQFSLVAQK